MSKNESNSQEPHDPPGERRDTATPVSIATTDPSIESVAGQSLDRKRRPDGTESIATTQLREPNLIYGGGDRSLDGEDRPRNAEGDRRRNTREEGRRDQDRGEKQSDQRARNRDVEAQNPGREEDDEHDDKSPGNDEPHRRRPSMMKNILMTAGISLICGVVGAAGYSHFFGPKSADASAAKNKPDSKSVKASDGKKKSSFSGTESVMESNSRGASSIPGFTASEDADTLKKQIADLMERVDGLSARIDRLSRPKDETPPVLHTMQIKMGELARLMDDVSSLPAKVRHYDNRVESLQEEIKTLRSRIESLTSDKSEGSNSKRASPDKSGAAPEAIKDQAESPTMELGVTLLERGQYASAREIFMRLELAQPRDARVWYFGALAAGLTSGKWDGEAKQFVEKGIERERAGTPSTAEIDAALATRKPITGESWLNSLRRNALNPNRAP
jgi:chaperonin cofactor prefoldin